MFRGSDLTSPNPSWLGAVQMYLTCPSANFFNQYIGEDELTGLPLNNYSTLSYPIPAPIAPMAPVSLAANTLSPVALTCGFSVQSAAPPPASVDLKGSQNGTMSFFEGDSVALPFHTVDCRTGCGTPGWYELHTILWNQALQEVGFEIVYLDDQGVRWANGITLPDSTATVTQLPGATFAIDR